MRLPKLVLLLLAGIATVAQPPAVLKLAQDCSTADLKKNLYYLASPEMEGRMMATHGDTLASLYIAGWFKQNGLKAPYDNGKSYMQAVEAAQQKRVATLTLGDKVFDNLDGWQLYPAQPLQLTNAEVVFVTDSTFEGVLKSVVQTDLAGKVLAVNGKAAVAAFSKNIDSVETVLKNKGAVAVVWFHPLVAANLKRQKDRDFLPHYQLPPALQRKEQYAVLPELAMVPERMAALLAGDGITVAADGSVAGAVPAAPLALKSRLSLVYESNLQSATAPNIIGVLPGSDPSLPVAIVSAHHDHDGRNGSEIYYGAVDNASGTVAIMQLAKMMQQAGAKGLKPKRTIVFVSFTGEERGLLGSFYYADHPLHTMEKTYAVMNIDMLGRVDTLYSGRRADSSYAYYMAEDTLNRGLYKALLKANETVKLTLDPRFTKEPHRQRSLSGSDQYPFYLKGVPFVRIECGFCADYHKPTDTPDKINYPLLTKQTQLAFLTLWNIANN